MKVLILGLKTKKVIVFSFLLSFLFSGIGVVQGFPIFFTTMAHAHTVFFSSDSHRIRLILHHPGNQDGHETQEHTKHQHDLLDRVIAVSEKDDFSHRDHELEISATEDVFSGSVKTDLVPEPSQESVLKSAPVWFSTQKTTRFSGRSPPNISRYNKTHATTILLI
ncbi:hypothetical protein MNBD_NITROSPIRAE01-1022 [hydrothermal vent metagenome]|uniref:Uncharacterized protein n=1 Tax=hydrothermal vent metagenome TaxID=652676 RepID=A0A3B1CYZ9_9ZZZZ